MPENRLGGTGRAVVLALAAVVLAGDVWLVRWMGRGAFDQIDVALRILGLYTTVLGLLQSAGTLAQFGGVLEEMTSPDFFRFAAGNGRALGMLFLGWGNGLGGEIAPGPGARLARLGQWFLLPAGLLLMACAAFHILVVMPLAYVGYLVAGAIVQAIARSSRDTRLGVRDPFPQAISLRAAVTEDVVASRSFLVGVPSLVLSLAIELLNKGS